MGRSMNISNPQGAEHAVGVDPGYTDDPYSGEFSTIQAAIDHIYNSDWYSGLSVNNLAVISIAPGTYAEQITCYNYITLEGIYDQENFNYSKAVIITHPVGKSTEPIMLYTSDAYYYCKGISFIHTYGSPFMYLTGGQFVNCRFELGKFIENDSDGGVRLQFINCTFTSGSTVSLTGIRGNSYRDLYFNNCYCYTDMLFESTHATHTTCEVDFIDCRISGSLTIRSDFDVVLNNSRTRNTGTSQNRNIFGTSGYVNMTKSNTSCGIHFETLPSSTSITECNFNDQRGTDITLADITSDVTITDVNYVNNVQQNGICGTIQIHGGSRNIGGESLDRYYCLQCAVDSVPAGVDAEIKLYESYSSLSNIILTGSKSLVINGQYAYELNFTGNVMSLSDGQEVTLLNMAYVRGYTFELNGAGASLIIENCITTRFNIVQTGGIGALCVVYGSTHYGRPGYPGITITSLSQFTVSAYSYIEGGSDGGGTVTAQPAILFNVDADNTLKGKFSTFIHGANATNSPISRVGIYTTLVSLYMCAGNASLTPAGIGNTITGSGNVSDSSINF